MSAANLKGTLDTDLYGTFRPFETQEGLIAAPPPTMCFNSLVIELQLTDVTARVSRPKHTGAVRRCSSEAVVRQPEIFCLQSADVTNSWSQMRKKKHCWLDAQELKQ